MKIATSQTIPTRLSNLQMELLKLYSYNVSESELKDIQKLLANYFSEKIDTEMDQLWGIIIGMMKPLSPGNQNIFEEVLYYENSIRRQAF